MGQLSTVYESGVAQLGAKGQVLVATLIQFWFLRFVVVGLAALLSGDSWFVWQVELSYVPIFACCSVMFGSNSS